MKEVISAIFIVILSLATLSAPALNVEAQQSAVDAWPMFHHDLLHTGLTTSSGPSTNQTLWNFTTGGRVWSSPAVSDGIVCAGSFDHNIYALNATTGKLLWNYTTGDVVHSSAAISGGIVYIGSDDRKVYALDATNGKLVWSHPTGDQVQSSPAISNGIVYIGSNDNNIYAL